MSLAAWRFPFLAFDFNTNQIAAIRSQHFGAC